ncbi:hypothetical protein ANN_23200 [Periplaneta americana]|uniref:Uncharacterized protein n=1 Tax=Periplaneta americana TaxID=6978 RepID=A0ABQ8SKJ8_PERAM|nr:hypothetical protein ANN_23200 [Periplaneta americana]
MPSEEALQENGFIVSTHNSPYKNALRPQLKKNDREAYINCHCNARPHSASMTKAVRIIRFFRLTIRHGLRKLFVYAYDVNMLGKNLQTIMENTGILLEASKAIDLEKTNYDYVSSPNIARNGNIKIEDLSFEEVEKFKYLEATITNINDTRKELKRRINMGNACYYSVEKLLSSSLLSKNLKVRIYKTVTRLFCMVVKLGLSL